MSKLTLNEVHTFINWFPAGNIRIIGLSDIISKKEVIQLVNHGLILPSDMGTSYYITTFGMLVRDAYRFQMKVQHLLNDFSLSQSGVKFNFFVELDKKSFTRVYIQIKYSAPCSKTGKVDEWSSRKWYLSEHMTEDEIVKTLYAAFEMCVKHEVMEGFQYKEKQVFNPHTSYLNLYEAAQTETTRENGK